MLAHLTSDSSHLTFGLCPSVLVSGCFLFFASSCLLCRSVSSPSSSEHRVLLISAVCYSIASRSYREGVSFPKRRGRTKLRDGGTHGANASRPHRFCIPDQTTRDQAGSLGSFHVFHRSSNAHQGHRAAPVLSGRGARAKPPLRAGVYLPWLPA